MSEVEELLTDPEFYASLSLPDLSLPDVLESSTTGPQSTLRLRYRYVGSLDPAARRLLGPDRLAWIQELVIDRGTGSGRLSYQAPADPKRLFGSAELHLEPHAGGCIRRLHGDLVVAVPLIGPRAERKILPGLLRRLDIEAQAINDSLSDKRR